MTASIPAMNRELAERINAGAKRDPHSPYVGKFVGIANGQIMAVADSWREVSRRLRQVEPDKGFLPISVAAYLQLLDWTARQAMPGKQGSTPSDAPPILERLRLSANTWCELLSNFGRLFSTAAGHPRIVDTTRSRHGHRRFHVTARVRELLPVDP